MNWILYWPYFEAALILAVFGFVFWRLWRNARKQARVARQPLPSTLGGRLLFATLYIARLLGVGLGTLALLILVVMIERNLFTFFIETAPTPSQVNIPADLGFEVQEVVFEGGDGLKMAGWFSPSHNGATVILLHGYSGNRTGMIWHARQLTAAGYGVLMYDERASGESEGTHRSYGWEDPRDVGGAVAYLSMQTDEVENGIGILGCSMGAQIALQGAAYHPQIGAAWADGPSTIRAQDVNVRLNPFTALLVAGNYTLDWVYQIRLDMDAPAPMIEIIDDIAPRPIMIVAGGSPSSVIGSEGEFMQTYIDHAGENAEMWVIPEAHHCDGPLQRPEEYAQRMIAFFDDAFGIERR
jgi:pimeloyl-ACP methyl ester carboxylesterase